MKRLLVLAFGMTVIACGSSGSTSTSPSPTPTPTAPILSLSSPPGGPSSYSLRDNGETTPGQIAIGVVASNFGRAVSSARGTLLFDTKVLAIVDYSDGDWLKQGGAIATFSVTGTANGLTFRVDRPTSFLGVTGTGLVVTIRLRPATGVRSGSSPLQWTDAHAYNFNLDDQLFDTQGGTITIR